MGWRRNLLVVLAHGMRSDALGDSASWPLSTPNMAKLSKRGLRLVASSACPADRGGMISVLTGLHARQHGQVEPMKTSVPMEGWAAWLTNAGYHVAGAGCVAEIEPWLKESVVVRDIAEPEPARCAYLTAVAAKGMKNAVTQQRRQRLRSGLFEPDRLLIEPDDDVDGFIMVEARMMLARMPSDKPWALVVMLTGPANDLPPPTIYSNIVDPESVDGGFMPADFTQTDALCELDYPRVMLQRLEPSKIGRIRADYLGRVSLIDYGIGRLQSVLASRQDHDRTWTVVTSDRGQLLGEHGLVGHRSFLAPAVEVPVLIAPPMPKVGEQSMAPPEVEYDQGLLSTTDVAPTIAALGGCDLPRGITGRSLLPILKGEFIRNSKTHSGLVSEYGRRLMLDTDRYKTVFDTETHAVIGLYDLLNDPDEKQNMVTTVTGQNLLDSLRWRLGDALLPLRAPGR